MWFRKKIKPEKIKSLNESILRALGIGVIDHLPHLDVPEFRGSREIAERMMVLLALFQLHLEAPVKVINDWIVSNGLFDKMMKKERQFLKTPYGDLEKQDQVDIYWLVESIWAFAWIGGMHNKLTLNTGVEDSLSSMLPDIERNESPEVFIENFQIRSEYEVFVMLDQFYRANWFARNCKLTGQRSPEVDLEIILERRKSLEFSCYSQNDWDKISLDT